MSLDDLFGLLLFLAFVILPTLGRATRGKKPSAPPARPTASTGPRPTASTRPASPLAGAPASGDADELERRLAEARERVRRAMEGSAPAPRSSSASAPASASRPAPSAPAAAAAPRGARPAPLVRDRDDGLLSTPLAPQAVASLGAEGPARRPAPRVVAEAPALQVERRGTAPARTRSAPVFATDPQTLVSAIVWHQVLGEPRARRPAGGRPSTLRSR